MPDTWYFRIPYSAVDQAANQDIAKIVLDYLDVIIFQYTNYGLIQMAKQVMNWKWTHHLVFWIICGAKINFKNT